MTEWRPHLCRSTCILYHTNKAPTVWSRAATAVEPSRMISHLWTLWMQKMMTSGTQRTKVFSCTTVNYNDKIAPGGGERREVKNCLKAFSELHQHVLSPQFSMLQCQPKNIRLSGSNNFACLITKWSFSYLPPVKYGMDIDIQVHSQSETCAENYLPTCLPAVNKSQRQ